MIPSHAIAMHLDQLREHVRNLDDLITDVEVYAKTFPDKPGSPGYGLSPAGYYASELRAKLITLHFRLSGAPGLPAKEIPDADRP